MNKIQVIGLMVLVVGIILTFTAENENIDFFGSLMMGVGFGMLLASASKKSKS